MKSDVGAFTFIHEKDLKNYPRLNFKEKAISKIHQFFVDSIKGKRLKLILLHNQTFILYDLVEPTIKPDYDCVDWYQRSTLYCVMC